MASIEPTRPAATAAADPRPSRLARLIQISIAVLLGLSLISGLLVWWGQTIQARELRSPAWLRPSLVLHGALYPFLCVLFGYLGCQHIRAGWELKANRLSGFFMEFIFVALILSGAGLYYFGDEFWRSACVILHRICGLALPAALTWHWLAGLAWAKKISN